MFENLTDKLQRVFKNLRGQGTLTEENIAEALREIRVALLEAMSTSRLSPTSSSTSRKGRRQRSPHRSLAFRTGRQNRSRRAGLAPRQRHRPFQLRLQAADRDSHGGLQGSGKTTTSGKLAAWLKKGGHRPMLVSVDVYRQPPASSSKSSPNKSTRASMKAT